MPELRIREIVDSLNTLGGMTAEHHALITELVATCLMARPQPVTCNACNVTRNASESEISSNTKRQRRFRERYKALRNVTESCNGVNNITNSQVLPENPPLNPPPKPAATRLVEDFRPADELWDWGLTKLSHETLRFETAAFCDYWHSQPGARGKKLDWNATWRNWVREAVRRRSRAKNGQGLALVPTVEGPKRTYREIKAEREAAENK